MIATLRIEMLVDYCLIEHCPKEQSAVYQSIKADFGELAANEFTYERGMNGSDELQDILFLITGGEPPSNYKKGESA